MKLIKHIILPTCIALLSAFTVQQSINYKVSEGYSIKFSGTDAEGIFKDFSGDIQFDEADLTSSTCSLLVEVNSINTGNGMKNKHAKSDKWFDAKNYPFIEFKSSQFNKTEKGYTVIGKMKIHGIEKEISIPFTFVNNVFASSFSVNRLDYKVGTMEGSSKKVSNEIKLEVSIPVTKQ